MIGDMSKKGQREYGQEERFLPTEEDRSILPRRVTGASVPKGVTLAARVRGLVSGGDFQWVMLGL